CSLLQESFDPAWQELLGLLDDELNQLDGKHRSPLLLCYLEGKTQEEAATQLGLPRGTLKRRLESGRALLARRLARRGVTLTGGLLTALPAASTAAATAAAAGPTSVVASSGIAAAALLVAAGKRPPPDLLSENVLTLARGVLHAMFVAK